MTARDRQLWKSIRDIMSGWIPDKYGGTSGLSADEFNLLYGEVNAKCHEAPLNHQQEGDKLRSELLGSEIDTEVLRHADTVEGWNAVGTPSPNRTEWTAEEILKRES